MGYKQILDKIIWSFSTLNGYYGCPYYFYQYKILGEEGIQNYYTENGSLCHSILERIFRNELNVNDSVEVYIDEYDLICNKVKQSTMDNTFESCCDYFCTLDLSRLSDYEITGVELKCEFKIDKYNFVGYIDLLIKDKKSEEYIIIDHKSCPHFLKKNGEPLKNSLEDYLGYKKQMYLYSKYIYETYGKFPKKLCWNHFRDGGTTTVIDFDMKEYEETLIWAKEIIRKIYKDKRFEAKQSYMKCFQLCNFRDECEYKNLEE